MKKIISILMIAAIALLMFGCSKSEDKKTSEKNAEPATVENTRPFGRTEEPEWAPVDCDIALVINDTVCAENSDFPTFALIGSNIDDCGLLFEVDKTAAGVLSMNYDESADCYLAVNGEALNGTVSFNDDFTEMTFRGDYNYTEMCEIASTVRGL